MRFDQYLKDEVDTFINMLHNDVKDEIINNANSNNFLFRGISSFNKVSTFDKFKSISDREPVDTPKQIHDMIDRALYKKFGWKPRSEGVFTTGSYSDAHGYGRTYIFFPIGDYEFVWSTTIKDCYLKAKKIIIEYNNKVQNQKLAILHSKSQMLNSKEFEELFIDNFSFDSFKDNDLTSAINSGNEIIFKCKEYYLVNIEYFKTRI